MTEELTELEGVESVDVVLETGLVTVVSEQPLDPEAVAGAITEAGYVLA